MHYLLPSRCVMLHRYTYLKHSMITRTTHLTTTFRFAAHDAEGNEIGRARLVLIANDLHEEPYGLLEDLYVAPSWRSAGIGRELHDAVLAKAREQGCYKLIGASRNDGTRDAVHAWYERLGYVRHGIEFRMTF